MNVFRHAYVISAFTGLSRLLGLVREICMADVFGTSLAKSAFDIAFKFPNLFRRLFGEGALSAAFIPILSETLEHEGPEEAKKLAGKVATLLATVLLAITLGTVGVLSVVIRHASLGEKSAAILPLLRIMFPYMFCICLVALCMGILNTKHRFALPAATPILLNVGWIAALYFLCPRFGDTIDQQIYGVAWGILIAGICQLAIQAPALARCGLWPRFSFAWDDPRIGQILRLMGPATIGMGIHQLNVVVDGILAIWVATWAPAALTYAERLVYLPLGIFATALSTVLLPTFSKQAASGDLQNISKTMATSLKGLMLVMIPATAGLIVLAEPIVQLFFERGEFNAESTIVTTRALWFYAPGLIVFSLYKILVPAFYALKDTRTPVRIGIYTVLLNLILNILFIKTWPQGYRHAGLACATVIASGVNCLALGLLLTKRISSPGWPDLRYSFIKVTLASIIMAFVVSNTAYYLPSLDPHFSTATKLGQAFIVGVSILLGLITYAIAASILCRNECKILLNARSQKNA